VTATAAFQATAGCPTAWAAESGVEDHQGGSRLVVGLSDPGTLGLGGLRGLVEFLDAGGELEVALGQPALGVGGQGEGDLVQRMSISGW
jgi:hypothetical protein